MNHAKYFLFKFNIQPAANTILLISHYLFNMFFLSHQPLVCMRSNVIWSAVVNSSMKWLKKMLAAVDT